MSPQYNAGLRKRVKLTNPEHLYDIREGDGSSIPYNKANGRQLFNHYRHRMTNYDQVLGDIRAEQQGEITGRQEKQVAVAAAEHILEEYRNEHVKVIQDSQKKGTILKALFEKVGVTSASSFSGMLDSWFEKVGVTSASALSGMLDSWSEKIKNTAHLESSQRKLQEWNDTYRVQRALVKTLLKQENVSVDILAKVDRIYGTRSVNKAVELGSDFFNLEKSEIVKLIKSAVRYTKLSGRPS